MNDEQRVGLSAEELEAKGATALPDKEVVSILDLNADLDLAIDQPAPAGTRTPPEATADPGAGGTAGPMTSRW